MKVESMFVHWRCFDVKKKALKQLCQYLLYFFRCENFRVTLNDHTQIFIKKAIIYENDTNEFVFIFSTRIKCEEQKECDMKMYLLFCVTVVILQVK